MIEPLDPGRGRAQQRRFFADHEDGVEAADRSKIDDVLAETVLARIHDLFEFRDDGFRATVDDRKNSDRLTAHPVEVETERGIHRRAAFRAAALYEKEISRRVGANHSGFGRKAVQQLEQRLRRHMLQRHDGDAVAWFGAGVGRVGPA